MKKLLFICSIVLTVPCQAARMFMAGSGSGGGAPSPGSSDYIQNRNTLQSGATFYTSSGTVNYFTAGFADGTSNRVTFGSGGTSGILGIYSGLEFGGGFVSPPDFHLYDKNGVDYGGLSGKIGGGAQLSSPGATATIGLDSTGLTFSPFTASVATITTREHFPYLDAQSLLFLDDFGNTTTSTSLYYNPNDSSGNEVLYMVGTISALNFGGNAAGNFTDGTVQTQLAHNGLALEVAGESTFQRTTSPIAIFKNTASPNMNNNLTISFDLNKTAGSPVDYAGLYVNSASTGASYSGALSLQVALSGLTYAGFSVNGLTRVNYSNLPLDITIPGSGSVILSSGGIVGSFAHGITSSVTLIDTGSNDGSIFNNSDVTLLSADLNVVSGDAYFAQNTYTSFTATETIVNNSTITANTCGGIKRISSAGAVSTSPNIAFSTITATGYACTMFVTNVGSNNITLKKSAYFSTIDGNDVVLGANNAVIVGQAGAGPWYQLSPSSDIASSVPTLTVTSSMTIGGAIYYSGITTKTSNYTLATDTLILASATSSGFTLTLPTAASKCGLTYGIKKVDFSTGTISFVTTASQTIDGSTSAYSLTQPNETIKFVSDCSNWTLWP